MPSGRIFAAAALGLALAAAGRPLCAQGSSEPATPPLEAVTRAELWDKLREKKQQDIRPPERTGLEQFLYNFREKRIMERFAAGWHDIHPKMGGLQTGSGFAMGAEYRRSRLWQGVLDIRATGLLSMRRYQLYEFQVGMPRLRNERAFLDFTVTHRNFPQEDYFGLGPDSRREDRSNYRLEGTSYVGTMGVRFWRKLRVGTQGGMHTANVGPGTDPRFASTELIFNPQNTPGLDSQPDLYQVGAFTQLDYRDEPGNPRSGGNYVLQYNYFGDRSKGAFSFRRYEAEFQQYIPFLNRRRVIAFRARTSLSDTGPGNNVPFYMMESLGGSEDLRGFREFRFRDRNLMIYNLEYRWEAFSGLDMALFGDAGKVFRDRRDFDLAGLEGAYGIGFRFNQEKAVFLRLDVGKSREGVRFFFKFGHVF
jgi:outer membrane protein assembly factor BamA